MNAVDKTGLKTIKNDFSSGNSNFYCKINHFIDDKKFDVFKSEIEQQFGQFNKIEVR